MASVAAICWIGAARQTTITFFIERGFKVYTPKTAGNLEALSGCGGKTQLARTSPGAAALEMTPAARAERFLESTLTHR